ncbi:hypothetical protein CHGG_10142 [Chaetomium globosum CBS 148.51]|uniref:Uncharacterized protein n=1 Tax=Chaetomium globosum (strain ATCC 6205 / CBS 148.51 / DSM 1962 / NBRC 6347 / NRRL 1970) TaxID=306901 RepID=Q2GPG2_CHAGB|nr:uncharacterized protein CHGG_10142 [Chaetomium globosum CBS 148.51]EAQ83738.1 hypothetical protein CHGG_10142 [Chaetomium globosum CBS 148.51]
MINPLNIGAEATRDSGMLSQEYVAVTAQYFVVGMHGNALLLSLPPAFVDSSESGNESVGKSQNPARGHTIAQCQSSNGKARVHGSERDARVTCRLGATPSGIQGWRKDMTGSKLLSKHEEAVTPPNSNNAKPSTFSEERLKWVPRKRHNSRWPIEPKKESTRMVADLQPLIEFEVPASPAPSEAKLRMDENQMGRRSTRRLSRRISLIPGEGSPRKLPMITLSPAEISTPMISPIKRPPVSLSPTKVADSPHRSFRVSATPMKVVLDTPKINPPEKSPAKPVGSPATPENGASASVAEMADPPASEASPASPLPLMFDQPIPDVRDEPQYEACRRRSLQSARRSDRGSSGASRLLALKSGRTSPNRRHSFTSLEELPADVGGSSKGRRNTMDAFCVDPEEIRGATSGEEVVEIDMKTSLDIFGQPSKTTDSAPRRDGISEQETTEETRPLELEARSTPPADVVPMEAVPAHGDDSVATQGPVFATSPTATKVDMGHDSTVEFTPHTSTEAWDFGEESDSDVMFIPQDPEGLSTIFEESTYLEDESPANEVEHTAQPPTTDSSTPSCLAEEQPSDDELIKEQLANSEPSVSEEGVNEASTSGEATPPRSTSAEGSTTIDVASEDAVEASVDERPAAGSVPEPHVSASHVADTAACMASPDSPLLEDEATSTETSHEVQETKKIELEPPSSGAECDAPKRDSDMAQAPSSPSRAEGSTALMPGTPNATTAASSMEQISTPENNAATAATQEESSGFTPINGRQPSPTNAPPSRLRDEDELEADQESDELDADEVLEEELVVEDGDEAAMAMDLDEDMTVEAPRPEYDTLQLHSRHDDSETEMLRNFVTRVTADKNAKAAAAAAALVQKIARRSSSIGSTTSTGSPMTKPAPESPASRTPLGVKSPNSPSLSKKRKAESFDGDDLAKDGPAEGPSDQPSEPRRLKRRRTRAVDPILSKSSSETTTTTPSPEPGPTTTTNSGSGSEHDAGGGGPRRSTRARSTRVALRPSAPSANSIAFSMIPVRLPGMGAMDEAAMDAHLASMARQRSEEKGLAAATRANTRKNKGAALPPPAVLARQAEDPAGWRMRELKGVWEAKERRAGRGGEGEGEGGVEETEEPSVFRGMARELLADVMDDDGVDEIAEAEPPMPAEPVVEKTARVAARKGGNAAAAPAPAPAAAPAPAPAAPVSTRRTRSSRLPPPTPVKKMRGSEKTGGEKAAAAEKPAVEKPAVEKPAVEKPTAAPSLRTRARSLPKRTAATAAPAQPAVEPTPAAAATKSGVTTRRTRVTKLGMSGNGTPAPKRRGKAAAV